MMPTSTSPSCAPVSCAIPLGALVAIILAAELVFAVGAWSAGGSICGAPRLVVGDEEQYPADRELLTRYISCSKGVDGLCQ